MISGQLVCASFRFQRSLFFPVFRPHKTSCLPFGVHQASMSVFVWSVHCFKFVRNILLVFSIFCMKLDHHKGTRETQPSPILEFKIGLFGHFGEKWNKKLEIRSLWFLHDARGQYEGSLSMISYLHSHSPVSKEVSYLPFHSNKSRGQGWDWFSNQQMGVEVQQILGLSCEVRLRG